MSAQRINRADFLRDPASALELASKGKVEVVDDGGNVRMTLSCPVLDDCAKHRPLTADADCKRCKGTGVVKVFVPTGPIRYGGPPQQGMTMRGLCSCVGAQ